MRDVGFRRELALEERLDRRDRPPVHPRQETEREHVLRALRVLLADAGRFDGSGGERAHRQGVDGQMLHGAGTQRIGVVARLAQVPFGELVAVDDDGATSGQIADVGLEGRRVHRDQHVGPVPGGEDVVVGDLDLKARDPGKSALRCADLGGEVGLCGQVVAEGGRLGGEPVTGELHAVAGVAGDADDDLFEFRARRHALHRGPHAHMCNRFSRKILSIRYKIGFPLQRISVAESQLCSEYVRTSRCPRRSSAPGATTRRRPRR